MRQQCQRCAGLSKPSKSAVDVFYYRTCKTTRQRTHRARHFSPCRQSIQDLWRAWPSISPLLPRPDLEFRPFQTPLGSLLRQFPDLRAQHRRCPGGPRRQGRGHQAASGHPIWPRLRGPSPSALQGHAKVGLGGRGLALLLSRGVEPQYEATSPTNDHRPSLLRYQPEGARARRHQPHLPGQVHHQRQRLAALPSPAPRLQLEGVLGK